MIVRLIEYMDVGNRNHWEATQVVPSAELLQRVRERWLSIASSYLHGISLPAVELIQVGDIYFVRDGHHRISVSRAFGEVEIDAEVWVWSVATQTLNPTQITCGCTPQLV